MQIHNVGDVFTPSSPAKENFVEREKINKRIVRAIQTKGMQIIIYGPSGAGKTTLIENKLLQTYEKHIKTSCMKGMTYNEVILDAFDQLKLFYLAEETKSHTSSIDVNLKANFELINTQLKSNSSATAGEKQVRLIPPQLTAQNLARFMGAAGYCWILDDFHKIDTENKEELSQLMKVFMDSSVEYPELKIICVGAQNTARQVVYYDSEMKGRVAEIKVPLMHKEEIRKIIIKGFQLLNIKKPDENVIRDIYYYSNGLASICHKMCSLICEAMNVVSTLTNIHAPVQAQGGMYIAEYHEIERRDKYSPTVQMLKVGTLGSNASASNSEDEVNHKHLIYAINEYLDDCSDSIKQAFDKAFKISIAPSVLESLTECGEDGESLDGVLSIVKEMGIKIERLELKDVLDKLSCEANGSIVTCNDDSLMYSFNNPFLMTFARNLFEHVEYKHKMSQGELFDMMNSALNSMQRSIT